MSTAPARFVRFDLTMIATTQPLRVVLPIILTGVFCVTLPVPGIGIVVGAVLASISVSVPFQGDERGRLDVLYGIAPVGRIAVVLGRYVTLLVFAIVTTGVGAVTSVVVGAARHQDLGWPLVSTMLLVAFGSVSVAIAVQVPWFFALGFTRGRPMIYVPVGILAILGFVTGQTGLLDGTTGLAPGVPPLVVTAAVLIGGVALLAGSAAVAVHFYRRREL
ncbi:MAG: ABC-2 transporter permease [Acidobacteria bacterium]|nr:ABC-2 transporter permease [Acidobacteriota bacterium]